MAMGVTELLEALRLIEDMPYTMMNDSESLRHTIRAMQFVARSARISYEEAQHRDGTDD
jgi:hypothetical protein